MAKLKASTVTANGAPNLGCASSVVSARLSLTWVNAVSAALVNVICAF